MGATFFSNIFYYSLNFSYTDTMRFDHYWFPILRFWWEAPCLPTPTLWNSALLSLSSWWETPLAILFACSPKLTPWVLFCLELTTQTNNSPNIYINVLLCKEKFV